MSKNSVLLGIKYEAARIGEVDDDALAGIDRPSPATDPTRLIWRHLARSLARWR